MLTSILHFIICSPEFRMSIMFLLFSVLGMFWTALLDHLSPRGWSPISIIMTILVAVVILSTSLWPNPVFITDVKNIGKEEAIVEQNNKQSTSVTNSKVKQSKNYLRDSSHCSPSLEFKKVMRSGKILNNKTERPVYDWLFLFLYDNLHRWQKR